MGAEVVCAQRNRSLQSINLRFNNIGDAGAVALGDSLKFNTTLLEMDLGGNAIGEEGGEALAHGLMEMNALTKLNLRCSF